MQSKTKKIILFSGVLAGGLFLLNGNKSSNGETIFGGGSSDSLGSQEQKDVPLTNIFFPDNNINNKNLDDYNQGGNSSSKKSSKLDSNNSQAKYVFSTNPGVSGYSTSFGEVFTDSKGKVIGGTDVKGMQSLSAEGVAEKTKKEEKLYSEYKP